MSGVGRVDWDLKSSELATSAAGMASQSRVAIIGAGLPIAESSAYDNVALVITGAHSRAFLQRIPVPIGMWRPFGSGPGIPLRLTGPGTIDIAGERVAF